MRRAARSALADLLRSAPFARAYTLAALTLGFLAGSIQRVNGLVTVTTIIGGLAVIGIAILAARRDELSLIGFAPTSLFLFLVWSIVSLAWALDGAYARTMAAWLALVGWAAIAVTIAHVRDTLQVARAVGDVLRWLLAASLAIEVFSGIIFDAPLEALGVKGLIAYGGPIQGLFGSRNMLGFVAVLALITFVIEWRARAVARRVAVYSLILAGLLVVLSGSPTALVTIVVVVVAELALSYARRTPHARRRGVDAVIGGATLVGIALTLVMHRQIAAFFASRSGFGTRTQLWQETIEWIGRRPVTGWSLFGTWHNEPFPTNVINLALSSPNFSGLNAYLDVLLQLGWVGLLLFALLGGVALVRAWLAAADRRSVVHAWLPLTLVALLVTSVFESYALTGIGWMLLVMCAVRAGRERSWRLSIDPRAPEPPPARPQGGNRSAR